MATIIFSDGKRAELPYSKASVIYQILQGNETVIDRATNEQLVYVQNVQDVVFSDPTKPKKAIKKGTVKKYVDEIMADNSLTGHQKLEKIAQKIRRGAA